MKHLNCKAPKLSDQKLLVIINVPKSVLDQVFDTSGVLTSLYNTLHILK
jgi:hypothetical protein